MLFGPDVAKWQEELVDWDGHLDLDSTDAWVDFVTARAIHQDGRPDATYPQFRDWSQRSNIPFAAYVWVDGVSPATKAAQTAAAIGDPSIPVMVDWEDEACSAANMEAYIRELRARGYRVPLLYTGRGFWQAMGSPRLDHLDVELVVARYGNQVAESVYQTHERYAEMEARYGETWDWTLGGLKPAMWQFGSRVLWSGLPLDMNAVRDPAVIDRCFKLWAPAPTVIQEDEVTDTDIDRIADRVLAKILESADGKHLGWHIAAAVWRSTLAGTSAGRLLAAAAVSGSAGATPAAVADEIAARLES